MIKLPIYKIFVEDAGDFLQIALVDQPAIEEDFLKFKDEPNKMKFESDKQIISGPVMIPDQLIYRNDAYGERYVYYDVETVAKAATLFLKNGMKFNEMHDEVYIKDIDVIESYITKSVNEFNVPEGSWIITAKIKDSVLWERIKSGEFNGFSFQSIFTNQLESSFAKTQDTNMKEETKMKIMEAVNKILFGEDATITTIEPVIAPITAPNAEPVVTVETPVEPVVEPVIEPVVEPAPVITEPVVEPIVLTVDKVNEMLIQSQSETISKLEGMISELSKKIDSFGNTPITTQKEKTTVDNTPTYDNPASKYFPKRN